jgi:hypothetical protein
MAYLLAVDGPERLVVVVVRLVESSNHSRSLRGASLKFTNARNIFW